jgi:hypothetical protein
MHKLVEKINNAFLIYEMKKKLAMCPFTDSFAVKPFVNLNCEGRSSHSS